MQRAAAQASWHGEGGLSRGSGGEGGAILPPEDRPSLGLSRQELIKYAWPEDIWYHVDKESSAHVYIRLPR